MLHILCFECSHIVDISQMFCETCCYSHKKSKAYTDYKIYPSRQDLYESRAGPTPRGVQFQVRWNFYSLPKLLRKIVSIWMDSKWFGIEKQSHTGETTVVSKVQLVLVFTIMICSMVLVPGLLNWRLILGTFYSVVTKMREHLNLPDFVSVNHCLRGSLYSW